MLTINWRIGVDWMNNKPSRPDVARCRADMAKLLTEVLETTRKLERRLDVTGGWQEATAQVDMDADPVAALRIEGALLLRKARIHTVAALRANETNNLHSLAVQMRPVLECAGQAVFRFRNLFIAPDVLMSREKAAALLGTRMNADFYQTLRRRTKGQISPKKLRKMATEAEAAVAEEFGAGKPKRQKAWRFNQADKVAALANGHKWYTYLSEHFSHGKAADWRGLSWQGGVISMDKLEDEFTFMGLMSYLVEQVAYMNAATALCPGAGDAGDQWDQWIEPTLAQLRDVRGSSKALMDAARVAVTGELDGSTGPS